MSRVITTIEGVDKLTPVLNNATNSVNQFAKTTDKGLKQATTATKDLAMGMHSATSGIQSMQYAVNAANGNIAALIPLAIKLREELSRPPGQGVMAAVGKAGLLVATFAAAVAAGAWLYKKTIGGAEETSAKLDAINKAHEKKVLESHARMEQAESQHQERLANLKLRYLKATTTDQIKIFDAEAEAEKQRILDHYKAVFKAAAIRHGDPTGRYLPTAEAKALIAARDAELAALEKSLSAERIKLNNRLLDEEYDAKLKKQIDREKENAASIKLALATEEDAAAEEKQRAENAASIKLALATEEDAAILTESAKWDALLAVADRGSADYEALLKRKEEAILDIKSVYWKKQFDLDYNENLKITQAWETAADAAERRRRADIEKLASLRSEFSKRNSRRANITTATDFVRNLQINAASVQAKDPTPEEIVKLAKQLKDAEDKQRERDLKLITAVNNITPAAIFSR